MTGPLGAGPRWSSSAARWTLWVPSTTSTCGARSRDQVAVLLGQAAADHDLQPGRCVLQRLQVAEGAVELVVGVLPDAAGVEDDDVGVVGAVGLGAARRPRAGRRCARSRARSSGTRRCGRRSCAAPWRRRGYGAAPVGLRGACERSADGQPRGHRARPSSRWPIASCGPRSPPSTRRTGPAPGCCTRCGCWDAPRLRGLDRDRADPDEAGPPRPQPVRLVGLLVARPRHLHRRVLRHAGHRRRAPGRGCGRRSSTAPRTGRLRPGDHPAVGGRADLRRLRSAAPRSVAAPGDARHRDDRPARASVLSLAGMTAQPMRRRRPGCGARRSSTSRRMAVRRSPSISMSAKWGTHTRSTPSSPT